MRREIKSPESAESWDITQPSRGLGDTIAKGIHRASFGLIKPCGDCKGRQAVLNKAVPYRRNKPPPPAPTAPPPSTIAHSVPLTRHLLYHVYPVASYGVWQKNLDQMLSRVGLFNGRRLMGIVTDPLTDSADAVLAHICDRIGPDHGFEFIIEPNHKSYGEIRTFPKMLEILSNEPRENAVFFYGHAKGVKPKYSKQATSVHRWTSAMYETLLDDWPAIERLLADNAFVGSFRRFGKGVRLGQSSFHFSGSFWWGRSDVVFSRGWRSAITTRYWGAEAFPGIVARLDESACVFHDAGGSPYRLEYWESVIEPALVEWREKRGQ